LARERRFLIFLDHFFCRWFLSFFIGRSRSSRLLMRMKAIFMGLTRLGLPCLALALLLLPGCSNYRSGGTSGGGSGSHLVYAAVPTDNGVAAYRIANNTDNLTTIFGSPFAGGMSPSSVAVDASNKFVYAANENGNDISLFTIDSSTGALTEVMPRTAAGVTPGPLLLDSANGFLYVLNRSSATISVYSVDGGSGVLKEISGSPFRSNQSPVALALSPSGKFLFVVNANLDGISAFTVNSGVLALVPGSPFPVNTVPMAAVPLGLAVAPSGNFVYVANSNNNTLSILSVDPSTGALASVSGSPVTTGTTPLAVAFDPTGAFLYVLNEGSSNISAFTVDTTTGLPTALTTTSTFGTGTNPNFMTLDSSGKFFLVSNQGAKTITEMAINTSSGALSANSSSVTTDQPVSSIAVTN
jgi:6-phosphogluconolactonase (cycloisomerase 2 family)